MTISGSQFSGGTLVTLKGGAPAGLYDGPGLQSSGIFTGWNDSNGTATGNVPAELGGAFVVVGNPDGSAVGRYAAD